MILKKIKIPLQFSILGIFVTLFVVSIFVIMFVSNQRFTNTLLVVSAQDISQVSAAINSEIKSILEPTQADTELSARLIKEKMLDIDAADELYDYTFNLLRSLPYAEMAYWGDQQGNFVISRRQADGSINTRHISPTKHPDVMVVITRDDLGTVLKTEKTKSSRYDPRTRPWYKGAAEAKHNVWSNSYLFFSDVAAGLGITSSAPVFKENGSLLGVFGIDVRLAALSKFIAERKIGINGVAFIVDKKGELIAYPKLVTYQSRPDKRVNIKGLPMKWPAQSFLEYEKNSKPSFSFFFEGNKYLASYHQAPKFLDKDWLIGVVVPENDFIGDLKKSNLITLGIFLIVLVIAVLLISLFSTKITIKMKQLVGITQDIKNFELKGGDHVTSRVKEVSDMADAIYAMRRGLRSFQRYVPAKLVRQLVSQEEDAQLGGKNKNLSILFTDITNFTEISSQMSARDMMNHLCEYFDVITETIWEYQGTVDKYIGDAVMAFWGAPIEDDQHQIHACHAILDCKKRIDELNKKWKKLGKPQLMTRYGLHTGTVLVGNIGSTHRLNYTVIGDAVNVASRLESLNKIYGTSIIISDESRKDLQDKFITRLLDNVTVRGKDVSTLLYELIAVNDESVSADKVTYVRLTTEAFSAYQAKQWRECIALYQEIIKQYGPDKAASVLIERCQLFIQNPPADDWDGVWHYKSKEH